MIRVVAYVTRFDESVGRVDRIVHDFTAVVEPLSVKQTLQSCNLHPADTGYVVLFYPNDKRSWWFIDCMGAERLRGPAERVTV